MNIQQNLTSIQEIATEKGIDQKDIQLGLSMLISSALMQALEITKPENMEEQFKSEDIPAEIQNIESETDLETFNTKINSLLSKEGSSFQKTFKAIFEELVEKYLSKLQEL